MASWYTFIMKKVLAFDLDGTLAESKSAITPEMAEVLCGLLSHVHLAVISGAAVEQMSTQIIERLPCQGDRLSKFMLFPQNGAALLVSKNTAGYETIYEDLFSKEEGTKIVDALELAFEPPFNLARTGPYGDIVENRGGQVTLSGLGQQAPIEKKSTWDPDQSIRMRIKAALDPLLPEFDVKIGGMTSIDITRKGYNKAFAIGKMLEYLKIDASEALFFGDAVFPGGNDYSVQAETTVECIKVSNPQDTLDRLHAILSTYEEATRAASMG
ncbi:MAG: family hydrolase [Candidatus Taylorbacteria bacterium]|nr:family hydrolase [Candidatus Taylorbacteria bacterium]